VVITDSWAGTILGLLVRDFYRLDVLFEARSIVKFLVGFVSVQ